MLCISPDFCQCHNLFRRPLYNENHSKKIPKKKSWKSVPWHKGRAGEHNRSRIFFFLSFLLSARFYPSAICSDSCSACHDEYGKSHKPDICVKPQILTRIQVFLKRDDLETDQAVVQAVRGSTPGHAVQTESHQRLFIILDLQTDPPSLFLATVQSSKNSVLNQFRQSPRLWVIF